MEFRKILPSPVLQPFVRYYWVFDVAESDVPFSQLLFPFGSFELIFNLTNAPDMRYVGECLEFKQPDIIYLGQFTKPFILNFTQRSHSIGVSLYPWVGNLLFDTPANVFKNRVTFVESICNSDFLYEKLKEKTNETDCIKQLELFLSEKFTRNKPDNLVLSISKSIISNSSNDELINTLSTIGVTRRRIEQRFLESTGLTMGFFIRKIRFQKAVHLLKNQMKKNLTQVGLETGYFDQSHFIREFKSFAGITPKDFLKHQSEMRDFVSGLMVVNQH